MVDSQYINTLHDQVHNTLKLYTHEMHESNPSLCEEVRRKGDQARSGNLRQGVDCQGF